MEPVYYRDASLGCCPVKKYFEQYAPSTKDKPKEKSRKASILVDIDAKVAFVVEQSGRAIAPISFKMRDYDYFEIKHRKDKNIVIRVFYFRHVDQIVLLNALEKPDDYDTSKERRKIEKELKITQDYLNKFKTNPKLYEKYDINFN